MDILVYEHILGEEYSENSPSSLLNEAKLIVKCLIKDFAELYPYSKISLLTNKKNNFLFNDNAFSYHQQSLNHNLLI